jgi:methionine salvage enolase-phosphatase E1
MYIIKQNVHIYQDIIKEIGMSQAIWYFLMNDPKNVETAIREGMNS